MGGTPSNRWGWHLTHDLCYSALDSEAPQIVLALVGLVLCLGLGFLGDTETKLS
jgi:hypothetical protein